MFRVLIAGALALGLVACDNPEADRAAKSAEEGKTFLVENSKEAGVVTTKSGLQYKVIRSGPASGPHPRADDEVKVHYEGKFLDGEVFDSSYERGQPMVTQPNRLIKGWTEALQLMRPGDEWMLYIPPELGYGDQGRPGMPANSTLIFRLELIDVFPT